MSQQPLLQVQRIHPEAILPIKGSVLSAGVDLSTYQRLHLPAHSHILVKTGLRIRFPEEYYARIAPRSGLSLKTGLMVNAGVIDADYRGEVGVILVNPTVNSIEIDAGTRIAQLILERIGYPQIEEVDTIDIDETERGEGGFGSSDKK